MYRAHGLRGSVEFVPQGRGPCSHSRGPAHDPARVAWLLQPAHLPLFRDFIKVCFATRRELMMRLFVFVFCDVVTVLIFLLKLLNTFTLLCSHAPFLISTEIGGRIRSESWDPYGIRAQLVTRGLETLNMSLVTYFSNDLPVVGVQKSLFPSNRICYRLYFTYRFLARFIYDYITMLGMKLRSRNHFYVYD